MKPDDEGPKGQALLPGLSRFAKNYQEGDTVFFADRPGPTPEEMEARMREQAARRDAKTAAPPQRKRKK